MPAKESAVPPEIYQLKVTLLGTSPPVCTGGQLACPPEDCGGTEGYYDLLDAIGDPTHDQYEELRDWVGDDYDPQAFSIDDVNHILTPLPQRRSKTPRN